MSEAIDPINAIYKIQRLLDELIENNANVLVGGGVDNMEKYNYILGKIHVLDQIKQEISNMLLQTCLLYTSPSPRDGLLSRMPSSA